MSTINQNHQINHNHVNNENINSDTDNDGVYNYYTNKELIFQGIRLIGIILAVYVTMEYVLPVIFPFCIGFLIACILYPFRRWLERWLHLKREVAGYTAFFIGLTVAAVILALLCCLLVCGGNCLCDQDWIGQLQENGELVWRDCCGYVHDLTGRWMLKPEDYAGIWQRIRSQEFDAAVILKDWKSIGGKTFRLLAYFAVSMVSSLLMLHDYEQLRAAAGRICSRLFHEDFGQAMRGVGRTYIRAQLTIMLVITSQCIVCLLLTGERYWLGIGCLIGVCDALPFLGTGICLIPWAIWRAVNGRYVTAGVFVLLYLITSFTRQTLEPRLIGKKIGVAPLAVLFSIYVGVQVYSHAGFLLGPLSAFLIWKLYKSPFFSSFHFS